MAEADPGPRVGTAAARVAARLPPGPVLALALGIVWAFALLVSQARQLWFFGDDWDFLVARSFDSSALEPHNEHWSTIPLLVYRLMVHLFGIDHFLAWAIMPMILHAAIGIVLYRLMRGHDLPAWPSAISALVLVLMSGNVAEDTLWTFQVGFLGSALAGLVAVLIYRPSLGRVSLVWLVTILSLMSSGMGLVMGCWLGLYVLVNHGLGRAVQATIVPVLVYAAWYLAYGREAAQGAGFDLDASLEFVWVGLSNTWQNVLGLVGTGGPFFLLLLVVVLVAPHTERAGRLALTGMATAAAMFALISIPRAALGTEFATASRYSYFAIMMSLPAFATALTLLTTHLRHRRLEKVLLATGVVVLAVTGASQTIAFRESRLLITPDFKARTLAAVGLLRAGKPSFPDALVEPIYTLDLTATTMLRPGVLETFPPTPGGRQAALDGALAMQSNVSPSTLGLPAPGELTARGVGGAAIPTVGCATVDAREGAYIQLGPSADGSQVRLVPSQTPLQLQMVGARAESYLRDTVVTPGTPVYIGSLSTDFGLRVLVAPGSQICALSP